MPTAADLPQIRGGKRKRRVEKALNSNLKEKQFPNVKVKSTPRLLPTDALCHRTISLLPERRAEAGRMT